MRLRGRYPRWYAHVIRTGENSFAEIALYIEVDGKYVIDRRKQGWFV